MIEYRKKRDGESIGVSMYSSKSATWMFKESEWGEGVVCTYSTSVFVFYALAGVVPHSC